MMIFMEILIGLIVAFSELPDATNLSFNEYVRQVNSRDEEYQTFYIDLFWDVPGYLNKNKIIAFQKLITDRLSENDNGSKQLPDFTFHANRDNFTVYDEITASVFISYMELNSMLMHMMKASGNGINKFVSENKENAEDLLKIGKVVCNLKCYNKFTDAITEKTDKILIERKYSSHKCGGDNHFILLCTLTAYDKNGDPVYSEEIESRDYMRKYDFLSRFLCGGNTMILATLSADTFKFYIDQINSGYDFINGIYKVTYRIYEEDGYHDQEAVSNNLAIMQKYRKDNYIPNKEWYNDFTSKLYLKDIVIHAIDKNQNKWLMIKRNGRIVYAVRL